ncbi:uncharacterized protein TRIADDRAFT_23736 [Trichoplax adhaerens]|uniref:B box-type domain-containing protein n=1 Tax=Trichoplax adhaerens TaxID=10228 RepID=B3RW44_TRIAD|nr:hypothetical protein TRIADDRAFT_23736 [Trichoplax adhaerens]EDV25603.1 hypothetical protein TRIADDRAFT_23736 [Trichoplax adhaerens]|eukprot:XP_002111636.1 hypothetical protein TRIADDRAFT_23736 [Trichoplax adhaerens]
MTTFPINFVINNLLNVKALQDTKSGSFFCCDSCETDDSAARYRCDQCLQFLCDFCAEAHRRMSVTRNHNIASIEQLLTRVELSGPVALQRPYFCKRHKGEPFRYYCQECQEHLCRECIEQHRTHTTSVLEDAATQTKRNIEQALKKARINSKPVVNSLLTVKSTMKDVNKSVTQVNNVIKKTFDRLIELLQLRARELFSEVQTIRSAKIKLLQRQHDEIETSLETTITGCTLAEHVLKEGSSVEILNLGPHIINRLEELSSQKYDKSILQPQEDSHIEFMNENEIFQQALNNFGRINSNAKTCPSASSIVECPALHYCPTGKRMALTLITRDSFNTPRRTGGDNVQGVLRRLDSNNKRTEIIDNRDGTYAIVYSTWISGPHLLNITVNGAPIAGSPFKIKSITTRNFQGISTAKLSFSRRGDGWEQLQRPNDVICDHENNIFITDTGNDRVQIFQPDGQLVHSFGSSGSNPGQFESPSCLTLDIDGNVIVSDTNNNRVQVFTRKGIFIKSLGSGGTEPGEFHDPHGITIDKDGRIFVVDSGNHRIQVFSSDGEYLYHFGAKGDNPGQLGLPWGIAIDHSGNILITDYKNHRIQVFDRNGKYRYLFGSRGNDTGRLNNPTGITVAPGGQIMVADRSNHAVQIFAPDGMPLHRFGSKGGTVGQLKFPAGVCVDNSNNVIVADTFNCRIQVF